jgi:hypothetical protein
MMTELTEVIDSYIAMWNEADPERRRSLIARVWTEGARYVDPALEGEGHSGINSMVEAVQQRFPGHRFRRTSAVDAHHDRVRFTWELAPERGAPVVKGTDFGVVDGGNRLQSITGFFDTVAPS